MEKIHYTADDQEKFVVVKKPNSKILTRSQIEASRLFSDLIIGGKCLLRSQLDDYMEKVGIWSDEKEAKLKEKQNEIVDLVKTLSHGGIKLSEGKANAIKIKSLRHEINSLLAKKNILDGNTIEGQCDDLKLNFIISQCIFDEEGNRLFKSVDDYKDNVEEHIQRATNKLVSWIYGISEDLEKRLPENKFLIKYGFMNDDLRYIDEQGRFVDSEGRLENEDGRYINENGDYVNVDGDVVDEDGELIVEFTPFLEG